MGSRRSSTRLFTLSPYCLPVASINCHSPVAPALDTAVGLRLDSITGRYFSSRGRLYDSSACSKMGM